MCPAICALCGKDFRSEYFHTGAGGELVKFANYISLPEDMLGHPEGLCWLCGAHAKAARRLQYLRSDDALKILRLELNLPELARRHELSPIAAPTLWVTDIGPNRARVFAILRQTMGVTPHEANRLLQQKEFPVKQAWPSDFAPCERALQEAGAATTVRYDT